MPNVRAPAAPRVLVVDDEPSILMAMQKVLAHVMPEANVHTAASRDEAIEALGRRSYDAIVSDLRIGRGDGLDVLAVARKSQPFAVRILMTAYPQDASPMRVVNDAALDHVIAKPFHLQEFADLLQTALDERRRFLENVHKVKPPAAAPIEDDASAA